MAQGGKGGTQQSGVGTPIVQVPRGAAGYSANPMGNASVGFQDAFRMLQQAGTALPQQFSGYSPVTVGGAAAATRPQPQATAGYNAAIQQNPQAISDVMNRYQNPYETQVVQNTAQQMQDALRQTQMGNADAAIASGAFGGGRHGVVEGVANAQAVKDIGAMTAQLRAQGFDTAAGIAGQDIANTMQTGALNQQALNEQRGFNADSTNQMRQFNASLGADVGMFNAGQRNNMSQFNANNQNRAREFNATGRYGAGQDYIGNAMNLSSQFGNLAQASYGVGRNIAGDQMQAGNMQQQLMQQILQAGQSGFDQLTGSPQQLLQMRLAALGMNPLNNATTTTQTQQTNPGWGAMFGNLLGAAGNMFQFQPMQLPWGRG